MFTMRTPSNTTMSTTDFTFLKDNSSVTRHCKKSDFFPVEVFLILILMAGKESL